MVDDKDLPDNLKKSATSLAPEVVEILKIEGEAHININVLFGAGRSENRRSEHDEAVF